MSGKKWVAVINENRWVIAKVSRRKQKVTIQRLEEFSITENFPQKGIHPLDMEQQDTALSAQVLKSWLKDKKVPLKKLEIAFSCQGVITRMITLPKLSPKDLDKLLTEQVDQYFTLNISDYVVDYRILEKTREEEQERLRILLVAIPLLEWENSWKLWEEIGFKPKVTDFSADCLARFYQKSYGWENKDGQATTKDLAILDLGADRVEFILLDQGVLFLYSEMPVSLGEVEAAAKAGQCLGKIGPVDTTSDDTMEVAVVDAPLQMVPRREVPNEIGQDYLQEIWERELEEKLLSLFNNLTDFLNFFASRHYGKSVDQIFITGECADLPQLKELFEKNIGIESSIGFPRDWKPIFTKKSKESEAHWMKYGSLYGLAIRED